MNHAEPFNFGDWTETEKCSENCKLMLERTCEIVKVAGLTPMSCEDQALVKEGNTSCKCAGDVLYLRHCFQSKLLKARAGMIDTYEQPYIWNLLTIMSSGTTESTGNEKGLYAYL